ncbi:ImmA/IrrE family metallo-endopeptidase [Cohnella cholangitidis]|uniref:ImmA/IrrE family metallo-endopeptidase n=1 Tax=Cohnella cholangitidis TaxID=2598458 RepID=A0A7G5C0D2_9BACL|nr:ImmA/IrrE family metallo-endopeptidase [Cohnella cholangitidis]QMV42666.1 ImmA/IrrE family metallo-endopeptidase [Cohnella cholangitidis]
MNLKKVERLAYSILEEFKITEPHVPIRNIAKELGISVIDEDFSDSDISGMLFRDEEENINIIGVNSSHSKNRQRFTIAHEVGHFLLHKGETTHFDRGAFRVNYRNSLSSTATNKEEIEANTFAAAILMPEHFIIPAIEQKLSDGLDISDDINEIGEIAELFRVSPQALYIRLGKLGYI